MALLLTVATGAWAQDPAPIDLTPNADGLYLLEDLERRFVEAIDLYETF